VRFIKEKNQTENAGFEAYGMAVENSGDLPFALCLGEVYPVRVSRCKIESYSNSVAE